MTDETNIRLKDRFAKWQDKTNKQFGDYNNLIIGLSVGSLAFISGILCQDSFKLDSCYSKCFCFLSIILLALSSLSGIYLGYNRLIDFRKTTQKVMARIKDNTDELEILKEQTDYLGKLSWNLLYFQMITFLAGEFLFSISLLIIHQGKLF